MSNATPIPVNADSAAEAARIAKEFLEEFPDSEIKYKPAKVKDNRCLALAYIDARLVLDRLDKVVGINNWKDEYQLLPGGEVECRLSVRIAGEWITKSDVGGQSEQPDDGDKMKAAYSDALKRVAVKFGIGRFLYRRPQQWMDYDPVRKQIKRPDERRAPPQQRQQPAPAPPAKEHPALVNWRTRAGAATDRAMLEKVYREFDADKSVPEDVRGAIVAAFKEAGKKFPAPQPAKA